MLVFGLNPATTNLLGLHFQHLENYVFLDKCVKIMGWQIMEEHEHANPDPVDCPKFASNPELISQGGEQRRQTHPPNVSTME